jgi:hypothetical protein
MIALNAVSVGTLITNAIAESANKWAIAFLIFTVGVLNLAKAYSTIKGNKQNKDKK